MFLAHSHAVAFLKGHAVEFDAATGYVHIGVAVGGEFQCGVFLTVYQGCIDPGILAYVERTIGAIGRDDQLQTPAFFFAC